MELKYFETVLAVAHYLNFSRAAEEIPCSQASVSRQVSAVESELGYALFERSTKSGSVRLTDRGALVIPRIELIVESCSNLFGKSVGLRNVSYRLGICVGPFNLTAKSKIISHTYLKYPEISLVIGDVKRGSYLNMLIHSKIDGMLLYEAFLLEDAPLARSFCCGELSYVFLKTQYPYIAFPNGHPLASRVSVSFSELRDETFLLNYDIMKLGVRKEDIWHDGFLRSCRCSGFTPKIATIDTVGGDFTNVRDTAVKDRGWIYPTFQPNALRSGDSVVFVPVIDPIYCAQYYFITLKDKFGAMASKVHECLLDMLEG